MAHYDDIHRLVTAATELDRGWLSTGDTHPQSRLVERRLAVCPHPHRATQLGWYVCQSLRVRRSSTGRFVPNVCVQELQRRRNVSCWGSLPVGFGERIKNNWVDFLNWSRRRWRMSKKVVGHSTPLMSVLGRGSTSVELRCEAVLRLYCLSSLVRARSWSSNCIRNDVFLDFLSGLCHSQTIGFLSFY